MKFEKTEVFGIENALVGMRLPMSFNYGDAANKSDSDFVSSESIGEKDLKVVKALINGDNGAGAYGQPNSKFLRMIHCQVCITGPMYWLAELDTYKIGTTRNSSSVMHKGMSKLLTLDDFEIDDKEDPIFTTVINKCNEIIASYKEETDKYKKDELFRKFRQLLPSSYNYTIMFDCDYSTLRSIYHWRKNHRLTEWHDFCHWVESLPYFKELISDEKSNTLN